MTASTKVILASGSPRRRQLLGDTGFTFVVCDSIILEKPASPDDARRMLTMLSGRSHIVVTAFALARDGTVVESEAVESRVTFRVLGEAEIVEYVASGEPLDKAGAYGI